MRSIIFTIVTLLGIGLISPSFAAKCDQTFYGNLRLGHSYTFSDNYTNNQSFRHNIAGGFVTIDETVSGDLNRASGPGFSWTPAITGQDFEIAPGQSIQVLLANSPYNIYDYPTSRSNPLLVIYSLDVQGQKTDGSWTRPPVTHNECKYYTITRCGDGVLDSDQGEQCDLGTQNGQPGSTCSATCTPVVLRSCTPGPTTGVQPSPLTAASVGLCPAGQSVGGFTPTTVGNVTSYAWSCNGSSVGGACTASYSSIVASCTPGTTTGPQAVALTATTNGLCPAGQSVGGFAQTVVGATTNYVWSCNGSPVGGACSASFTPTAVACIAGTVTGTQASAITASTPGLCPAGQTSSEFVSMTLGSTTNYFWACNGNNGGNCNANFTPTGVACVAGPTTGIQSSPISATSTGLCPAGQMVGGFTATTVGTVTSYAWSCNGSLVGGSCSASYSAGGGGLTCTPGNFTRDSGNVVPAPISVATTGLCPAGETVGNFTDTTNGTTHSYAWSCNTISAGLACTAFYTPGGGGGGGGSCQIGTISGVQYAPISSTTPGLCASGYSVSNFQSTASNGSIVYTWSCGGYAGCSSSYVPSSITVPGANSYCGNGVVERPNSTGVYETCDTTASWCDSSCSIASTNPGSISPGKLTITTPGSSALDINTYRLIVGDGVSVFSPTDSIAFEANSPMYLQNKTATITNRSSLINGSTVSKVINNVGVGGVLRFKTDENKIYDGSGNLVSWTIKYDQRSYPSSTVLFQGSELQGIKGDTSSITSGSYEDTITTNPTYRGQGIYASLQYLESPFHIRVSLPIIGNVAGGSAYIGSALGNSVNTVVQTFFNNLRSGNFTTSTVNANSSYALSSSTRSVSGNNTLSAAIVSGSDAEAGKITQSSKNTSGIYTNTSIASEFEIDSKSTKLGDTSTIRVFKDGDVSIDGNLDLTGVKTIIVENGNLIINKDIRYADKTSSFAWIVKNGNVIVASSVKNIAGVYVTLAGAMESDGTSTTNRLTVDGSLYGNTSDLVNHRSYVRGQTGYSALNVGVIVNYSNRAIMYPPPFLSRFLDQYSLQRVAR